jgi:hypothetical protein
MKYGKCLQNEALPNQEWSQMGIIHLMEEFRINLRELCELFNTKELSHSVVAVYEKESPIIYRNLSQAEREILVKSISDKIADPTVNQAGPNFQKNWEKNWEENLVNFKNSHLDSDLIPKFISSNESLRFKGDYIIPLVPDFEMKLVRILRQHVFEKYLSDIDALHEFGAGTGFNLIHFGQMYPMKQLHGYDWVESAVNLISLAGKSKAIKIDTKLFDMFKPDYSIEIANNSGLLTVGALEQPGKNWHDFLSFMISKKFSIYINIETIYENYLGSDNPITNLAKLYIEKRNWLQGYFQELQNLETKGMIEIIEQRVIVGSRFHDSWSYTVWKLKGV